MYSYGQLLSGDFQKAINPCVLLTSSLHTQLAGTPAFSVFETSLQTEMDFWEYVAYNSFLDSLPPPPKISLLVWNQPFI